jgi:hypothetical protein
LKRFSRQYLLFSLWFSHLKKASGPMRITDEKKPMAAGNATIPPSRERVVQAGNSTTLQLDLGAVAESWEPYHRTPNLCLYCTTSMTITQHSCHAFAGSECYRRLGLFAEVIASVSQRSNPLKTKRLLWQKRLAMTAILSAVF